MSWARIGQSCICNNMYALCCPWIRKVSFLVVWFYADFRATPFGYPLGSTSFSYMGSTSPQKKVVFNHSEGKHTILMKCIWKAIWSPEFGNVPLTKSRCTGPIPLSVPRLPDRPEAARNAAVDERLSNIFKMLQNTPWDWDGDMILQLFLLIVLDYLWHSDTKWC